VIDDHRRYAYVAPHPDQGGDAAAAVLGRAIDHLGRRAPKPAVRTTKTLSPRLAETLANPAV
jgi:hypothetical protein